MNMSLTGIAKGHYLCGDWLFPEAEGCFRSQSVGNHSTLGRFPTARETSLAVALPAAQEAFDLWRSTPAPKRGQLLYALADALWQHRQTLALEMTHEIGKLPAEALGELEESVSLLRWMASEGRRPNGFIAQSEEATRHSLSQRRPLGVCALVTPWNYPAAIFLWKLAAALVAGNAVVWKPSPKAARSSQRLLECLLPVLADQGCPPSLITLLQGDAETARLLTSHPLIRMLSFTGSSEAGASLGSLAVANHKRIQLEMGGLNPCLVFSDAPLATVASDVVRAAFASNGQRCTATRLLLVEASAETALVDALLPSINALVLGDALSEGTQIAPLIDEAAATRLLHYLEAAQAEGAVILAGGRPFHSHQGGCFVQPTLLKLPSGALLDGNPLWQQEVFGPLLRLTTFTTEAEALALANASPYGLAASLYSDAWERCQRLQHRLEAGLIYLNAPTIGSEFHFPFGGCKASGNGPRELGPNALEAFSDWTTLTARFPHSIL